MPTVHFGSKRNPFQSSMSSTILYSTTWWPSIGPSSPKFSTSGASVGSLPYQILSVDNPSQLADLAVYSPDLSLEQKVEVLETLDLRARLGRLLDWMKEVLADLNLRKKIREDATERIDKGQRDYILRQQMEAIRKELGDDDDVSVNTGSVSKNSTCQKKLLRRSPGKSIVSSG